MLQNIKVDIVYYMTNTDFEMEFNLCGCCRMRLLTDKAADRKSFINMLARAVSRSRVIITCGALFSETGLIETVAQAIGKPLEVVDNKAYGISGSSEIKIIGGAIPLVTSDGVFGGCIIESGPQTIILLSESRNVRKNIMQNLIHPYIEEISIMPSFENAPRGAHEADAPQIAEEPIVEAEEDVAEVPDETEAEEAKELEEAEETEVTEDSAETEDFPTQEDEIPLYIVPERVKYNKTNYYDIEYKSSESDEMFIAESDSNPLKKISALNVAIIVVGVFLVLLLLILAYFLVIVPISGGYSLPQYFRSIFTAAVGIKPII